jgi:hypothetical protein
LHEQTNKHMVNCQMHYIIFIHMRNVITQPVEMDHVTTEWTGQGQFKYMILEHSFIGSN